MGQYNAVYKTDKISSICESQETRACVHGEVVAGLTKSPTKSPVLVPTTSQPSQRPSTSLVTPSPTTESSPPSSSINLFPNRLRTQLGSQLTDQDISVLQSVDMEGTENDWDTYIELGKDSSTNAYRGVLKFEIPASVELGLYRRGKLLVNYYGPSDGRW